MYRKLDKLGRIVIPKEIREELHIKNDEILEIRTEKNKIIIEKNFKHNLDILKSYRDKIDSEIKKLEGK